VFERSLAQFGDLITDTSFVLDDSWGQVRPKSSKVFLAAQSFQKIFILAISRTRPCARTKVCTVPNVPHGTTLHAPPSGELSSLAASQPQKPGMFYYAMSVPVPVLEKGSDQGRTPVHYSAQRKHILCDTLGTLMRWTGHNSSHTEHKTAH
jgi:hypothetical protein